MNRQDRQLKDELTKRLAKLYEDFAREKGTSVQRMRQLMSSGLKQSFKADKAVTVELSAGK